MQLSVEHRNLLFTGITVPFLLFFSLFFLSLFSVSLSVSAWLRRRVIARRQLTPLRCVVAYVAGVCMVICGVAPLAVAQPNESIRARLQQATLGELSLDEFAQGLIRSVEQSPAALDEAQSLKIDIPGFDEVLGELLLERVERALITQASERVAPLETLARHALAPASRFRQAIERRFSLARKLEGLGDIGDTGVLTRIRQELANAAEQQIFAGRVQALVLEAARAKQSANEPDRALAVLAAGAKGADGVVLEQTAAEIVTRWAEQPGIGGRIASAEWALDEGKVQDFIQHLLIVRPELEPPFITIFSERAVQLAEAGKGMSAEDALLWVVTRRPDPNAQNDELRLRILRSATHPDSRPFVGSLVQSLQERGALSVRDKFRLTMSGYFGAGKRYFLFLVFFCLFAGVVAVLLRPALILRLIRQRAAKGSRRPPKARAKSRAERRAEKRGSGYLHQTEAEDEYSRLLAVFGLRDGATEAQIKKAYREAVKKAHPDAAAGGAPVDEEVFQELKKVHDRIMEIRGSWFGSRR
ncbi:MAG: J domain-containing protein [Bdellovibrionales bacterium]|nr:J domain-containing protein [Bdellovibrionales bacterium]